jgi:hypothetical protein
MMVESLGTMTTRSKGVRSVEGKAHNLFENDKEKRDEGKSIYRNGKEYMPFIRRAR